MLNYSYRQTYDVTYAFFSENENLHKTRGVLPINSPPIPWNNPFDFRWSVIRLLTVACLSSDNYSNCVWCLFKETEINIPRGKNLTSFSLRGLQLVPVSAKRRRVCDKRQKRGAEHRSFLGRKKSYNAHIELDKNKQNILKFFLSIRHRKHLW